MHLEAYPAMKDSGVPWLGDVPEHWNIRRIKFIANMQSGDTITSSAIDETGTYPVYGGNGLRGYTKNFTHDGQHVLIGRQGALCGNINYAKGKFWASEHAIVASLVSDYEPVWFGELLRTMNLNQYSQAAAQPGVSVEFIKNLAAPVPSITEQTAIVRFLDHAERRIRRYVREKRKLIRLLEEQKRAIIHQAVTRQRVAWMRNSR